MSAGWQVADWAAHAALIILASIGLASVEGWAAEKARIWRMKRGGRP